MPRRSGLGTVAAVEALADMACASDEVWRAALRALRQDAVRAPPVTDAYCQLLALGDRVEDLLDLAPVLVGGSRAEIDEFISAVGSCATTSPAAAMAAIRAVCGVAAPPSSLGSIAEFSLVRVSLESLPRRTFSSNPGTPPSLTRCLAPAAAEPAPDAGRRQLAGRGEAAAVHCARLP